MKEKIFSSLSLFLLLGGNAVYAEELPENIFDNTLTPLVTPADGVYEVSNGGNKKIIIGDEVAVANIAGGINVSNGTLNLEFAGQLPQSDGYVPKQTLRFGSTSNTPNSQLLQATNVGVINFVFGDGFSNQGRQYAITENTGSSSNIVNGGEMKFDLKKYSSLSIEVDVQNNKNAMMNFSFGDRSAFEIKNKTITNSGSMVFDFTNANGVNIGGSFINQSDSLASSSEKASISFRFLNSQNIFFGKSSPLSLTNQDADNKNGVVFSFEGNSFVGLGEQSSLSNMLVSFAGDNNFALFGFETSKNTNFQVEWLSSSGRGNYISFSPVTYVLGGVPSPRRKFFNTIEIGQKNVAGSGISGNGMNFVVYANISKKNSLGLDIQADANGIYTYADRIIIHSAQDNSKATSHNLGVIVAPSMLKYLDSVSYTQGDVTTKGNIAVATVANNSNVTFNALNGLGGSLLGFNLIETSFEKVKTNEKGILVGDSVSDNDAYTTYFLSSARDVGVTSATQEATSSVFSLNYDLFLANFNSLNKRMGDLRNNPYSQGAWGRIFNGQLSNDFGLGSQNNYTTLQAGYDYDFGLENAKNYLGVAFSYGFSISEMSSNAKDALQSREIKDIFSNSIELALYNAYVSDNGLYSDSIAKFSYLMSDFNLTNNGTTESLGVNNYALSLSEEVGYVFTLGENKEWSITPQAELGLGYYSSSDLTQVAGEFYLDAKADSLLMLRARVGSVVGYDFKQFTQGKDIQASLYAGLSYEFDYLNGGDIELTPNVGNKTLTNSALSSDSRGVLNIGTNLAIKDNTRLYVDFQTSFGGKINTDYQVNIGARFSFGEKSYSAVRANNIANPPIVPSQPQQQETNIANKK